MVGRRCVRLRIFEYLREGDNVNPHFSLYFDLEGTDPVRAIFDLDVFFCGIGAESLPPGRYKYRLLELEELRPFSGRLISRVDFLADSNGCKKLTLEFEARGSLTFWNDERASRLVTKAPNGT